ncbi:MAG: lipase family protein [Arenicella sp.]|nr:lipase family protein [Arenicella sp.]
MTGIWKTVLLLAIVLSLSACGIVKPEYPIDMEQSAALGFDKPAILTFGRLVNLAYKIFDAQLKDNRNDPNPPFPSPFQAGFTPIANLQGMDSSKGRKELYGHLSWLGPEQHGVLVISIRGTSDRQEWIDDWKLGKVHYNDNRDFGRVELGFKEIFASFTVSKPDAAVFVQLDTFMRGLKHRLNRIIVVGHSLGSSLATLVAFNATISDYADEVELLTFASPLTGDAKFVSAFQSRIKNSVRVVNKPDLIPRVPAPYFGYRHIWHELEIDSHPIKRIKHSIACYHSLPTYLYVLDGGISRLEEQCVVDPGS